MGSSDFGGAPGEHIQGPASGPPSPPLPLPVKIGYGAAELGMSAVEVMLQLYLLVFYTETVDLEAQYAGTALALAILWDAMVDPAMGAISDHTRTRWGKRRPYIFIGSVSLAVSFTLLFSPPKLDGQLATFLYLLLGYMFVNTSMTFINVPHSALGGELSFDRNVRTELFGWRLLFKNFGFLLGAMLPGVLLEWAERGGQAAPDATSRSQASLSIGLAVLLSAWVTFFIARGYDKPGERMPIRWASVGGRVLKFLRDLYEVATSKVFLPLLIAYCIAFIGRTINASLALFYYRIRLGFSEYETVVYVLGLFMVVLSFSILIWVGISRRWGKKLPAFWGAMLLGIITTILYPLLPAGELWASLFFVSVISGSLVGSIILFDSLVADIVDYDELVTGHHREGLYFGCWLMATKVSRAAGLVATGWMLKMIGFDEDAVQHPPEVGQGLALMFGPGVGILFILAALVFLWMPLTDQRHRRIQVLLQRRQAHRRRA
ncbi:MAG: MFS transporter [Candidatus Hydrogenedentes bacterium]|nr:MFS transporter [Candidatus Hydrogenedentota bacterium]